MRGRTRAALVAALTGLLATTATVAGTAPTTAATTATTAGVAAAHTAAEDHDSAVIRKRVLGRSVQGRKIMAYRLGEPGETKVVLISTMHGNEPHTRQILRALVDGKPVHGIDLWVVPTYNPDGLAAGTRKNARGVDLNRNYPHNWRDLDGNYESGPRPASEPETRAMMRFLRDVKPRRILSFHQPLHGVDTDTKDRKFAQKVARKLDLPRKTFDCGGVCHGTMTSWYNATFKGSALTVEYGASPPRRRMRVTAPRQVLSIWGAWRGDPQAEPVD
ncbi:M14 family zinc carboxypeptidase [Nocardioides sp. GCM10027113]|uniref:M14 family zinc carboxypeptidase n=1 Tax=unclassified Nocardioides TaxID=2615069 RepID=UPI0036080ED2